MDITMFIAHMALGGAQRVCINLANEFIKQGHRVTILVLDLNRDYDINTHLLAPEVNVVSLGVSRIRYAALPMVVYLRKNKPRFLLVFGNEMAVILNKLKKFHLFNTPLIVRVLNNVNISLSKEDNVSPIVEKYLQKAQKQMKDMDHVIAQCDAMKEQLLEKNLVKQDKISRIYNPISHDLVQKTMTIKHSSPKDDNCIREIVFIGRLDPQKNLSHLIEAFSLLNKENPAIRLRLIGNGNLTESLKKMVENKGLSDKVSFEGVCKNMEGIYAKADMIVLSSEYEGMPNCLIEAIGCGIPVVSYDCPIGPREIVVDDVNGYLVKYNNINELAEKMGECLMRDWDEDSIRKTAEKFDVSHIAKEYIDLFEKVTRK